MRHIDIRAIEPPPVIGRLEEYNPGDTITLYFRCRDDDDRGESGVISKRMRLLSKHKHHAVFKTQEAPRKASDIGRYIKGWTGGILSNRREHEPIQK